MAQHSERCIKGSAWPPCQTLPHLVSATIHVHVVLSSLRELSLCSGCCGQIYSKHTGKLFLKSTKALAGGLHIFGIGRRGSNRLRDNKDQQADHQQGVVICKCGTSNNYVICAAFARVRRSAKTHAEPCSRA